MEQKLMQSTTMYHYLCYLNYRKIKKMNLQSVSTFRNGFFLALIAAEILPTFFGRLQRIAGIAPKEHPQEAQTIPKSIGKV